MLYFNHAGTTWPKPPTVVEAMHNFHQLTPDQWLNVYEEGLSSVVRFFNFPDQSRFLFTTSCTSSLQIAFSDFAWEQGDRLIISTMEHHALSRWFHKLQHERGVEGIVIPRATDGPIDLKKLEQELKKGVKMVAISMASNVTGEVLPYRQVIELCHSYQALCLLDGAQTAGILPIDVAELQPDFFVFAGHKGPFGPQGIGGLYIAKQVGMACPTAACEIVIDNKIKGAFPSYCDTGSVNMVALAGLNTGILWLENQGWNKLIEHRKKLVGKLRTGLNELPSVTVLGVGNAENTTGAVSIISDRFSTSELEKLLWQEYEIKVSAGFQCAPMTHEALNTHEEGTVRFSVGPMTEEQDIEELLTVLKKVMSL